MSSTEELYQLIQTMSRAEIRNFRQVVGSNTKDGQSNYLKLFDLIRRHGDQGEELIRKKLRKEKFVEHLATTRYQLSSLLLQSLCRYNSAKDPLFELQEGIQSVRLLFDRGLWEFGGRLLKKVRRKAEMYDYHYEQIEIFRLERLELMRLQTQGMEQTLTEHLDKEKAVVQKLTLERAYADLSYRMNILVGKQMSSKDGHTLEKARSIMSSPLLRNKEQAQTFLCKMVFLNTHTQYSIFTGDKDNAYEYMFQLKRLWETEPHRITVAPGRYKTCLTNFMSMCVTSRRYTEVMPAVNALKALPSLSASDEIKTFLHVSSIELIYRLNTSHFKGGVSLIDEIEEGLKKYSGKMDDGKVMVLLHNSTVFLFLKGDFARTAVWIEKILLSKKTDIFKGPIELARLLLPIVQFELENDSLVEPLIRSVQRYLQRHELLSDFYSVFLAGLNKLAATVQSERTSDLYRSLDKQLRVINQEQPPPPLEFQSNILLWLKSRIEQTPINELYLRKISNSDSTL